MPQRLEVLLPQEVFGPLCSEEVSIEKITENSIYLEAKDLGFSLESANI